MSLEEQLDRLEEAAQAGDQQPTFIKFLPIIIPFVALPVLVVAGLVFFDSTPEPSEVKTVVVAPDENVMKIEPTEPGGIEIPDQDKTVYDPMKQGSGEGAGEVVMPPPETPMAPPPGGPDLAAAIPPPPEGMESILPPPPEGAAVGPDGELKLPEIPGGKDGAVLPPPAPPGGAETAAAMPKDGTKIVPPPKVPDAMAGAKDTDKPAAPKDAGKLAGAKTPDKPSGTKTAMQPPAPKSPPPSGSTTQTTVVKTTQTASLSQNYRVQIQSLNSQSQAEKAWEGWVKKHPDLLSGLSLTVQRAVIKDRGTFYRVQAGPFPDHKKADELCRKLKSRGQDCLVIRP